MKILPLSSRNEDYVKRRNLSKKFAKQILLLAENPSHPSLHVELLEPRDRGIYSFRIDRKYRALFIFRDDASAIEIIAVTSHYR